MRIQIKATRALMHVALFVSSLTAYSQTNLPEGVYMSWEEVVAETPSENFGVVIVTERSSGDIIMMGGNDYKVECENISKKEIRKEWYAYSDGKELYINCFPLGLQNFYAKVLVFGEYTLFNAAMSQSKAAGTAFMFGAVGGAITANNRYSYVIESDIKSAELLTDKKIKSILSVDQNLLTAFSSEAKVDEGELTEFIKAVNDLNENGAIEKEATLLKGIQSSKNVDLVLYRLKRKQIEESVTLSIADTISEVFVPNSYVRLKLSYGSDPIKVCDIDKVSCVSLDYSVTSIYYVSSSMTEKEPNVVLEIVKQSSGEWDSELAREAQRKREKKATRASEVTE